MPVTPNSQFGYCGQGGYNEDCQGVAMSVIRPIRSRPDAPQVSASVAKNSFGRILDRVAKEGRLAITKRDQPWAMLISIEEYRTLVEAEESTLNTLSDEFDALLQRMQEPAAAAAMQKAFALTPTQLGRAAVNYAALTAARRMRAPVNVPTSTSSAKRTTGKGKLVAPLTARIKTPASGSAKRRVGATTKSARRARG
jgi:antitoxin Phd